MIKQLINNDLLDLKKTLKKEFGINEISDVFSINYGYYEEDKLLGFINYSIIYERAELNYIFVYEKFRNNHIASKLINYMLKDLNNKNIKNITLEVNQHNEKAIKIYEKYNFKKVAVREKYYNNEDAYLMQREVGD